MTCAPMDIHRSYLPDGHPDEALAFCLETLTMRLNSGMVVPVVRLCDQSGDRVDPADARDYDQLVVVCGPVSSGSLVMCIVQMGVVAGLH